jgi:hypothetical protein
MQRIFLILVTLLCDLCFSEDALALERRSGAKLKQGNRDDKIAMTESKRQRRRMARRNRGVEAPAAATTTNSAATGQTSAMNIGGVIGVVESLDGVEDTILAFGADVGYAMSPQVVPEFGVLYWSYDRSSEYIEASVSMLNVDGGARYVIPVTDSFRFGIGGRMGYAQLTSEVTTRSFLTLADRSASSTESSLHLGILGGPQFVLGQFTAGLDVRAPLLFFDDKFDEFDPLYLLASVGLVF